MQEDEETSFESADRPDQCFVKAKHSTKETGNRTEQREGGGGQGAQQEVIVTVQQHVAALQRRFPFPLLQQHLSRLHRYMADTPLL